MRSHPELNRDSILAASKRIAGCVKRTPLLECHIDGARIWLKCESLQTGGAFKLRGATNRLLQLSEEDRARGVVAFSSGNHAQGVAIAAKRLDMRATIVMPADAPALKVEGTRAQGADIVFYDRRSESREEIAARIAAEQGSTVVPSFDDIDIITGQGTAGVEIDEQSGGGTVTHIVVPCGGGGLSAGLALALPDAAITIVEPEGWDDMGRSLALGQIVPVEPDAPSTLCDALQTPRVSPLTFGVLQSAGATAVSVSDSEAKRAIGWAWREHGLTLEAGGAVALAAVLTGKVRAADGMAILLSGGNIDPVLHALILAEV